jgi:hypothetical protein
MQTVDLSRNVNDFILFRDRSDSGNKIGDRASDNELYPIFKNELGSGSGGVSGIILGILKDALNLIIFSSYRDSTFTV